MSMFQPNINHLGRDNNNDAIRSFPSSIVSEEKEINLIGLISMLSFLLFISTEVFFPNNLLITYSLSILYRFSSLTNARSHVIFKRTICINSKKKKYSFLCCSVSSFLRRKERERELLRLYVSRFSCIKKRRKKERIDAFILTLCHRHVTKDRERENHLIRFFSSSSSISIQRWSLVVLVFPSS